MIAPGDIVARLDSPRTAYVVVLSNSIHLAAGTGRVICCPFVPGILSSDAAEMMIPIDQPVGVMLPEAVFSLPAAALAPDLIGSVAPDLLGRATRLVAALIA